MDESHKSIKVKPSDLYARSAVLMDAETGRILFGKNKDEQMPMASTTKIMTCILALENGNLSDKAEVSSVASAQPKDVYKRQSLHRMYVGIPISQIWQNPE